MDYKVFQTCSEGLQERLLGLVHHLPAPCDHPERHEPAQVDLLDQPLRL